MNTTMKETAMISSLLDALKKLLGITRPIPVPVKKPMPPPKQVKGTTTLERFDGRLIS